MVLDGVATVRIVLPALTTSGAAFIVGRDDLDHTREALETIGRLAAEVEQHLVVRGIGRAFEQPHRRSAQTIGDGGARCGSKVHSAVSSAASVAAGAVTTTRAP